jgi:hypothetical protein
MELHPESVHVFVHNVLNIDTATYISICLFIWLDRGQVQAQSSDGFWFQQLQCVIVAAKSKSAATVLVMLGSHIQFRPS